MSLLMLKTRNLTWQDHTLNIEVMLTPNRSQLLLNKHKTLDSKCIKDKFLFDKEQSTFVKDHIAEKRRFHRIKAKLDDKRRQLIAKKESEPVKERKSDSLRSFSAPPLLEQRAASLLGEKLPSQRNRPSTMDTVRQKKRFVSNMENKLKAGEKDIKEEQQDQIDPKPSESTGDSFFITESNNSEPQATSNTVSKRLLNRPKIAPLYHKKNSERTDSVAKSRRSVKFDDVAEETHQEDYIDRKVKEFILNITQFNSETSPLCSPKYANCFVKPDGSVTRRFAAVVSQYSYLTKNSVSLLQAFDNFCKDPGDKSEFHKLLKYVARFNLGPGRLTRSRSSTDVVTASKQHLIRKKKF